MQHSLDRDTACKLQLCHHGLFSTRNSHPPGITAVIIFQSWKLYIYKVHITLYIYVHIHTELAKFLVQFRF